MASDLLQIRVIAPDSWSELKMEFAPSTPVGEIKRIALPELMRKGEVDASAYYVEYFEKEILDESRTLADLEVPQGGVISIRPYDIAHPPPFRG